MTIAAELIKRTTHVSPTNLDRILRESVRKALIQVFHPNSGLNDDKEAMKDFVLSEPVTSKLP